MKNVFRSIPKGIRYFVANFLILYIFLLLFRLAFSLFFLKTAVDDNQTLAKAWYIGAKFDLRLVLIVLLPVFLLIVFFRNRLFRKKIFQVVLLIYFFIVDLVFLFIYIADLGNYAYLGRRIDAGFLKFLNWQDAGTNLNMVWESYPVIKEIILIIVLMFLLFRLHKAAWKRFTHQEGKPVSRGRNIICYSLVFILMAGGIYGNFSYFPLRWSQAMFSGDPGVTALGLNPVLHFVSSLKFRSATFDIEKTQKYYPAMADYLGVKNTDPTNLKFVRAHPEDTSRPKPNVVFVMLESTGASVTSMYGNPMQPTPNMKRLADSGVLFENFYVPAHSTARTVYGLITGLPDITETKTASRHPKMTDQRVIMDQFKGYEKYYLLGGNMNWANIRAIFTNNIKNIKLYEESYFKGEKADVWGISDYDLITEATHIFQNAADRHQPFVAFLQLADNHRPYTTTAGDGSFKRMTADDLDMEKFKQSGFISIDQFNALRYEDYNVGQLIKKARKAGYLSNTIFVFFGDHNCTLNPYDFMPLPEYKMGTYNVHVTAFIYGPGFFKPQRVKRVASLLDLFPTFARFTGVPFNNYTLGKDIFDSTGQRHYAFMHFRKNTQVYYGLMGTRFLYEIKEKTGETSLYNLETHPLKNVKTAYPDTAKYMDQLLRGYIQSTWYLLLNNQKDQK